MGSSCVCIPRDLRTKESSGFSKRMTVQLPTPGVGPEQTMSRSWTPSDGETQDGGQGVGDHPEDLSGSPEHVSEISRIGTAEVHPEQHNLWGASRVPIPAPWDHARAGDGGHRTG